MKRILLLPIIALVPLGMSACSSPDRDEDLSPVTITTTITSETSTSTAEDQQSDASTSAGAETPTSTADATEEAAVPAGHVRIAGNVVGMTGAEVMEEVSAQYGQPLDTPNGEDPTLVYYVIVLDTPQTMTVRTASGSTDTREITRVYPRSQENKNSLSSADEGRHIDVVVPLDSIWVQSDTGMPMGIPRLDITAAELQ